MHPRGGREPWRFASLSPRTDDSLGLPLSARVSQPPAPAGTGAAPSTAAAARMKSHAGRSSWDAQDSQTLLSLLDDGWYARSTNGGRPAPKPAKAASTRPAGPTAADSPTSSDGFPRIAAVRPLNLASLRDHAAGSDTPAMLSARSTGAAAATRPPSAAASVWGDTPRSFATAASLAASLPQTPAEVDALTLEEVAGLAEEAEALAAAAATAATLARARLRRGRGGLVPSYGMATTVQVLVQMWAVALGLLSLALLAAEAAVGAARRWRAGAVDRAVARARRGAYFAAGAVAGAAQGLQALVAAPPPHALT